MNPALLDEKKGQASSVERKIGRVKKETDVGKGPNMFKHLDYHLSTDYVGSAFSNTVA